jgi:hypothetical protein
MTIQTIFAILAILAAFMVLLHVLTRPNAKARRAADLTLREMTGELTAAERAEIEGEPSHLERNLKRDAYM